MKRPSGTRITDTLVALRYRARYAPRTLRTLLRDRWQYARRGWSDTDAWNLDLHLARRLAEQLTFLADNGHSYPGTETYPTYESWDRDLRDTAAKFRASINNPELDASLDEWFTHHTAGNTQAAEQAWARMQELEHRAATQLDEAFAWVAANHRHLWD